MNYINIKDQKIPVLGSNGARKAYYKGAERHIEKYTFEMVHDNAVTLFQNAGTYSLIMETDDGDLEFDKTEFSLACGVLDNLDGTVTVIMGKPTDMELLEEENAGLLFEMFTGEEF